MTVVVALVDLIAIGLDVQGWQIYRQIAAGAVGLEEYADLHDAHANMIGDAQFYLAMVHVFLLLLWVYSSNRAVRALGMQDLRLSPGTAVVWNFVPVFNLWMPFQAIAEIWRASTGQPDWKTQPLGKVLWIWWILWAALYFVYSASASVSNNAETPSEVMTAWAVMAGADSIAVAADVSLVLVVYEVLKRLKQAAANRVEKGPAVAQIFA